MTKTFYEMAKPLDELKNKSVLSENDIKVVFDLINDAAFEAYFFSDLNNPAWAKILFENGYLTNPPARVEVQGGFKTPFWHAGKYLTNIAPDNTQVVLDVAKEISTDNPRAIEDILRALQRIEPTLAVNITNKLVSWIDNQLGDLVVHEITKLLNRFVEASLFDAAFEIYRTLLEPMAPQKKTDGAPSIFKTAQLKNSSGRFWIDEAWKNNSKILISLKPQKTLKLFEDYIYKVFQIEKTISPEIKDPEKVSYWRSAVENHKQNIGLTEPRDYYVEGLRDSLLELLKTGDVIGEEKLIEYISGAVSIFNRIALYCLAINHDKYRPIVRRVLLDQEYFGRVDTHHEFFGLLDKCFGVLDAEEQNVYLNWVSAGPDYLEYRAMEIARSENREVSENDRRVVMDGWIRRRLWPVRDYLIGDLAEKYYALETKYGEPDHPDFTIWWNEFNKIPEPSMPSVQHLVNLGVRDLITAVAEMETGMDKAITPGAVISVIETSIKSNPQKYIEETDTLVLQKADPVILLGFTKGLRSILDQSLKIEISKIVNVVHYLAELNLTSERLDEDFDTTVLEAAQFEGVRLLLDLLEGREQYRDQFNKIDLLPTLNDLFHNSNPKKENEEKSGMDPVTSSLNSIRGLAAHCLFRYIAIRKASSKNDLAFSDRILEFTSGLLNIDLQPSRSVRSVFGWYFVTLFTFNKQWTKKNSHKVFPTDPQLFDLWLAAWLGYISSANLYGNVFKFLRPNYERAIKEIHVLESQNQWGSSPAERLGQHIILAYIDGLVGSKNRLLRLFYNRASAKTRSSASWFASEVVAQRKLARDDPKWIRIYSLWKWRLKQAELADDKKKYRQEVTTFLRLLKSTNEEFASIKRLIIRTIPFIDESGFGRPLILDYCEIHVDLHPIEIMKIILRLAKISPYYWYPETKVREVVNRVLDSGSDRAEHLAIEFINFVAAEYNDFSWADILPKDKK